MFSAHAANEETDATLPKREMRRCSNLRTGAVGHSGTMEVHGVRMDGVGSKFQERTAPVFSL